MKTDVHLYLYQMVYANRSDADNPIVVASTSSDLANPRDQGGTRGEHAYVFLRTLTVRDLELATEKQILEQLLHAAKGQLRNRLVDKTRVDQQIAALIYQLEQLP